MYSDLNSASTGPGRPARTFSRLLCRARRGFALIVTLSLMSLLLLLVLTLTTLVRINIDTATASLATAQARQNALLGAYIAIGQLQKFAGPDQRATATAYIIRGGQLADKDDLTAEFANKQDQVFGPQDGPANNTDTILSPPFGLNGAQGGTWYWTGVWGPGVNPLALYTGQGTRISYNGSTMSAPDPILMNWLISGDEGTPLTSDFLTTGTVAPPSATNGTVAFTPDAGVSSGVTAAISSLSQPLPYNWTALTNDVTMTPTVPPPGVQGAQPVAVLVGPNTAYTGSQNSYTITSQRGTVILTEPHTTNLIVAPIVTINNTTPTGSANVTSGRYAFWVGDEGVKAKLSPVDPYVGLGTPNPATAGDQGQFARYRFWTPLRNAIERLDPVGLGFNATTQGYGSINGSTTGNVNVSLTSMFKQIQEPSQIYYVLPTLTGFNDTYTRSDIEHPETALQQHYFDFTTSSFGVLSDELRGGLRYDLTTAFNETTKGSQNSVFKDNTNGLQNRALLPGANTTAAASITTTTEPNVVSNGPNGSTLLAPIGPGAGGNIAFHGPDCPPPPGATNPNIGGLRWDAIENFYNLAANNTGSSPVPVQAGSTIKAGITPLITQFRLRFGEFADSNSEQYVSVEPEFVLANPYSFSITDAGGGMDLGFRINTSTIPPGYTTGWEWFGALAARNDIRQNLNGSSTSGESIALGYDQTQTVGVNGVFGANFKSSSAGSSQPNPGYYPFLKDTIDYPSGLVNSQNGYNSVLDNIAFHIPKGTASTFTPGEAKVFSLQPAQSVTKTVASGYNPPEGIVTAWVGSPLTGAGSGTSAIAPGSIAAVPLVAAQPLFNPSLQLPSPYYFLRDTGISTATGKYINTNTSLYPDPSTPGTYDSVTGTVTDGLWPGHKFGYISTMAPAPGFTLELRSDIIEPSTATGGVATAQTPYSISQPNYTVSNGVAGPGQNVLQSITNMDLTGAGMVAGSTTVQPDPRGYVPPFALKQGFRRQYLGTTDPAKGAMPVFLSTYFNMLALPGTLGDGSTQQAFSPAQNMLGFYVDAGNSGLGGATPQGWFDPSQFLAYRVYADFNLRAANMALPPFASFNNPWANSATTPQYNGSSGSNNITAYMTVPPYGRVFDEGIGADDQAITGREDVTFSQNSLGHNGLTGAGFTNTDDAAWGYSNSKKGNGEQFVTLYSLPVMGASKVETVNSTLNVPDVPIMSLGQLAQADFTQDDIWCSIGYQPGNAFGNSYFTPYVTRGSVMQQHQNLSAKKVMLTEGGTSAGAAQMLGGASGLPNTVNAYDISYITNVALWDRYFFSTLVPSLSLYPANPRLVYAAGYSANTVAGPAGIMAQGLNPTDPVTNKQTFLAYEPARFMMIDGAFNINSTSFEAWRAVLSALRGVAFSNGAGTNGGAPVSYFSRTMSSSALKGETSNNAAINVPINDATGNTSAGINDPSSYAGFRQLTDDQIDILAAKIVQQVHQRGPFLSLAQFVNRNLQYHYDGGSPDVHLIYSVSGPLQSAIDMAQGANFPSFNAFFGNATADSSPKLFIPGPPGGNTSANSTAIYPDAPLYVGGLKPYTAFDGGATGVAVSANPYSVLTGIPGWLMQADLLKYLAPILAARSDTFTIRTYGEVLNPSINQANLLLSPSDPKNPITSDPTAVEARAWCEVVVQRMPDYIATDPKSMNDPSTTTGYCAPNPSAKTGPLSPVNAYFGRRFKIVSVRWITANDI